VTENAHWFEKKFCAKQGFYIFHKNNTENLCIIAVKDKRKRATDRKNNGFMDWCQDRKTKENGCGATFSALFTKDCISTKTSSGLTIFGRLTFWRTVLVCCYGHLAPA
jgi:hypothetical protein